MDREHGKTTDCISGTNGCEGTSGTIQEGFSPGERALPGNEADGEERQGGEGNALPTVAVIIKGGHHSLRAQCRLLLWQTEGFLERQHENS